MAAFFIRTANSLTPADDASRDILAGIAIGTAVQVEISRPRNIKFMRLYWALCGAVASSIGANRENVSDVIKLRSGHFTVINTKSGRLQLPKSISFAKMTEADFKAFFEQASRIVCEEILPTIAPGALRKEIEQMIGIPQEPSE